MSNIAAIFAAEGLTVNSMETEVLTKIEGNAEARQAGSFVLSGQQVATEQGFRNVSKIWYDKTMTFEQGIEKLANERAQIIDVPANVREMVPSVNIEGKFAFLHRPTEKYYIPTEHAMTQIGNWAGTGTWTPINLMQPMTDYKGRVIAERDREDSETLARLLQNGFRRLEQDKKFLFRCHTDGTMRAMVTDKYAVVDNRWFLERLQEFIPGGRLSHWKGDCDTIFGNVLIPDTIREETDSEYGAMLSVGNCEIGRRRVSSVPSIFRAICMNGCIWGQVKGKGIKQVHRGRIDLKSLALEIKENLNKQIPLAVQGIDKLLGTRVYAWDGAEARVVVAQVAKDAKLNKKQAGEVLDAWHVEEKVTPGLGKTMFGIINAITRAAQQQTPESWVDFDTYAGSMLDYDETDFLRTVGKAKALTVKEADEVYA